MFHPHSRRDPYSWHRSRRHQPTPEIEIYETSYTEQSSDYPAYYSSRRRSRSHGPHNDTRFDFYDTSDHPTYSSFRRRSRSHGRRTTPKVDQWNEAPRPQSLSDSPAYSDYEQYQAFDDPALNLPGDDWDEISAESGSSFSVISAIPEAGSPRIEPVRRIRRRGSAPELGNREEIQINAGGPRVRRRQRPTERGRLNFVSYDASILDRRNRLPDDIAEAEYPRSPLDRFDFSTRFEHITAPAGEYSEDCSPVY